MSDNFRYKQALVVRTDLEMGRGKIAVQCAHAAVSAAEDARKHFSEWWKAWLAEGQRKIALKVKGEDILLALVRRAESVNLPVFLVKDKGLTQIPADSVTCAGIGPAPAEQVDQLTGNLALL